LLSLSQTLTTQPLAVEQAAPLSAAQVDDVALQRPEAHAALLLLLGQVSCKPSAGSAAPSASFVLQAIAARSQYWPAPQSASA
jgi:hypothetical protein